MERNLIMYSGTNFPELNDKVFVAFESDLGIYYVKIWNDDKPVNLCKDNVVNVNFKPGDKVWYSYSGKSKFFDCTKVYEIEKCSLDEDCQIVKIKGHEGMYSAGLFNLHESNLLKTYNSIDLLTYDGATCVNISDPLYPVTSDDLIKALDELESKYSGDFKCTSFDGIVKEMNELYKVKNANYGDSFSKQFKEYGLTSSCIRLEDKLNRLKSLNKASSDGTKDESIRDTLIDLANYAVLTIMELNKGDNNEDKINR